jgi:hypothetical protein
MILIDEIIDGIVSFIRCFWPLEERLMLLDADYTADTTAFSNEQICQTNPSKTTQVQSLSQIA